MEEFLMLAAEAVITGAKIYSEHTKASAQDFGLETEMTQEKERGINQAERDQNKILKIMDSQKAQESVSGLTGPSFGAISKTSFNAFLNDEKNISLNTEFRENAMKVRQDEVKKSRNSSMFSSLAQFGLNAFKIVRAS